jgi:hypothetical protein
VRDRAPLWEDPALFFIVTRDGRASKMSALLRFGDGRIVFLLFLQ